MVDVQTMAVLARQPGDPARLGRWLVLGRAGEGSGTVVYEVTDGRGVRGALKTVRPGESAGPVAWRLHGEAAALRRAGTAGVVRLREDGSEAPQPYLVVEWVKGASLEELLARRGPLDANQVATLGTLLADVLGRIHRRGVAHGDLKPANVLCPDAGPILIDFDAARLFDVAGGSPRSGPQGAQPWSRARRSRFALARAADSCGSAGWELVAAAAPSRGQTLELEETREMSLRATPRWLAPELARGEPSGGAADVFSLGALLVYLSTGRFPFGSGRADEVLYRIVHETADLSGVGPTLLPIVHACLHKQPDDRPSAYQVARALLPQRHRPRLVA